MEVLKIQPVLIDTNLARFMGARRGQKLSHSVKVSVNSLKIRINKMFEPKIIFTTLSVKNAAKGGVYLEKNCLLKSPKLSKTLRSSKEAVCFIATIGAPIEKEIQRLFRQNSLARGYILDAMGSAIVENIVERFQSGMREKYKTAGKTVTLRFSPGYCDWPVTEQKKLFTLLDSERIGAELTDSCLMKPRKSISGIFGVQSRGEKNQTLYNPCTECKKTNCRERRDSSTGR